VIAAAIERGVPVVGELELAWRLLPNPFVAVTGTNGKTTVTELLGAIWRAGGRPVAVAGNVGTPLASLVGQVDDAATVACECSSFQLEDSEAFAPDCAVLLNVTPDHLDRHGTLERYTDAKLRIFANQGQDDVAVVNGDEPVLAGQELGGEARRVRFCGSRGCDIGLDGQTVFAAGDPLIDVGELRLLGAHNVTNAMAAAGAALAMGLEREAVAEGLRTFQGVPHRLERVAEIDGVLYVNDSKATNVAAAGAAIRAFEGGVRVILGGSSKGESFAALAAPIAERCAGCYLIGETADELERDLAEAWASGVERERCEDLATAVRRASAAAKPGDVVLLSPACASFDAFRDFEERGEGFRTLVGELRSNA
jgi:UDP-N-acetylmuramoylalanine--D-glutamate ligase